MTETTDTPPSTSIVGFTLEGTPPLGTVHIPWEQGLTVLYGANGAGKTTILRGIEAALRGVLPETNERHRSSAIVHVKLRNWDKPIVGKGADADSQANGRGRIFDDELTASLVGSVGELANDRSSWLHRFGAPVDKIGNLVQEIRQLQPGEVGPPLLDLLTIFLGPEPATHLSLSAVGTVDAPQHSLHLGYPRGEGRGANTRETCLKYELLRFRSERSYRSHSAAFDSGSLEEFLTHNVPIDEFVRIEYDAISATGIPVGDVDPDYAAACMDYVSVGPIHADSSLFWADFEGLDGREGFEPLIEEGALAPSWVPVSEAGQITSSVLSGLPIPLSSETSTIEAWKDRIRLVIESAGTPDEWTVEPLTPDSTLEELRPSIEASIAWANEQRSSLVPQMPVLSWRPGSVTDWLNGDAIAWEAADPSTGRMVPLSNLSDAQQRWAGFLLARAYGDRHDVLLVDEPELGLHRRAVAQLGTRLSEFAAFEGLPTIVATHSSEFLSLEDARLFHVARSADDGRGIALPVDRTEVSRSAAGLDLEVAELLQLVRTWIVVEGEHDRVVLNETIGSELTAVGAEIITMRGASNAVTLADAEVLFRYTDASILLILDAIDNINDIRAMWTTATARARDGRLSEARGAIAAHRQNNRSPGYEERQLLDFAEQAIGLSDPSRVRFFGFRAKDIIEYLDPGDFGLDTTWDALRAKFEADSLNRRDFKTWLHIREGAEINVDTIRAAATNIDTRRLTEFVDLLNAAGG